jgi:hypothetical protein
MKRPYIPLSVRLQVLERQAYVDRFFETTEERELAREWYDLCTDKYTTRRKIWWLKQVLFFTLEAELDHDPALSLRKRRRNGDYIPRANDPRYLVYRIKPGHLQKTTGRAPGAERTVTTKGSDTWLRTKFRKLEHPKKSRSRIPSRPFTKTKRPFRSRPSSSATRAGRDS